MRKISAALSVSALAAVMLTGCAPAAGTANAFGCSPAEDAGAYLSNVTVSGEFGSQPEVTMPKLGNIPSQERAEIIEGDGRQITDLNQVVETKISIYSSTAGELVQAGDYTADLNQLQLAGSVSPALPTLGNSLLCAHEGSRVIAAIPAEAVDPQLAMTGQVQQGNGIVAVVDVVRVARAKATGSHKLNTSMGLPAVVRTPAGAPGVSIPEGDAPTELTVQTLIEGDGNPIPADQGLVLNVLGVGWDSKSQFYNTWQTGSPAVQPGRAGTMIPGLEEALKDATIGSQLLIVVPQSQIAADADMSDAHPTDEPLIYVVDVIGAQSDLK